MAFRILDPTNAKVNPDIDPLDRWIFRWNLQTADSKERVAIEPISNSITGRLPGEKKTRQFPLSPAEQAEANRNAGRVAREMLGEGWADQPLEIVTAQRIMDTVRTAQRIERARIREKKLLEVMNAEDFER